MGISDAGLNCNRRGSVLRYLKDVWRDVPGMEAQ